MARIIANLFLIRVPWRNSRHAFFICVHLCPSVAKNFIAPGNMRDCGSELYWGHDKRIPKAKGWSQEPVAGAFGPAGAGRRRGPQKQGIYTIYTFYIFILEL